MFNATNIRGTKKYIVIHHGDNNIRYTTEDTNHTKILNETEMGYMNNYVFTVVNDTECICMHPIEKETDCTCDLSGFSVYVCHKNGANVLRNFKRKNL